MGWTTFLRCTTLFAVAIWLPSLAAAAQPADISPQPAYLDWFKPAKEISDSWVVIETAGDPFRVTIRRRFDDPSQVRRRIFVLFPRRSSAYDIAMAKILEVFEQKRIDAEFTLVNFENDPTRGRLAVERAEREGHQLIFSMGSQSTAWLWRNYKGGDLPVVSVCSKDPVVLGQAKSYDMGTSTNFAFTSLNMPVEVQMAYVLELKPDLKNLAVLVNSKNISAMETQAKPIAEYASRHGIRVLMVAIEDPSKAASELSVKVRNAVTTMRLNDPTLNNSVFLITGSTAVFREIKSINANSDRVPVLSVVPNVVKAGDDSAVLSIGIGFESNAHLAAIYGAEVLEREAKVGRLRVGIVSPPDIAINFRRARQIGLEIPFSFFESASFVYDYEGRPVRENGKPVVVTN